MLKSQRRLVLNVFLVAVIAAEIGVFAYRAGLSLVWSAAISFVAWLAAAIGAAVVNKGAIGAERRQEANELNSVAELYARYGVYAQAEPLFRRALALRERVLGADDPDTATSLRSLAQLYEAQGRYVEAEPLFRRALRTFERVLGAEHTDTATSLNNLATLYQAQGRYAEAERLLRRALRTFEGVFGAEHPNTAAILNNLALLCEQQGRYVEAEPLLRCALQTIERVVGAEHTDTATYLNNLARLYLTQGRYAEAEPLFRRALAIRERVLSPTNPGLAAYLREIGAEHPSMATSLNNLATLYQAQGRYAEAGRLLRRALRTFERVVGAEHTDTATCLNNLATLYQAQGRYAEGEPLLRRALHIFEGVLGAEHPSMATSLNNLALLCQQQGRCDEAEPLLRRALEICDRLIARVFATGSESARSAILATVAGGIQHSYLSLIRSAFMEDRDVIADALDRILRRKAITAEVLAAQRDAVLGGRYPDLAPRLKELHNLRSQIATKTLGGPGPEGIEQHRSWLAEWSAQLDRIEAELARQIPEMNLESRLRGVDRAAVANVLPAGSALVEYVRFTEFDFHAVPARGERHWKSARYLAFVLQAGRPDDVTLVDLGEAAFIDRRIAALREAVTGDIDELRAARPRASAAAQAPRSVWQRLFGTRHATVEPAPDRATEGSIDPSDLAAEIERVRELGAEVRSAVFDPLRGALGEARQLFLSPDGDLYRLPFEILPAEGDGAYLIDTYRLSYVGAGRDVLRFGARPATRPAQPLVVADPDFDLAATPKAATAAGASMPRARRSRDLDRAGLRFKRLEGARAEGEKVAGLLGARVWTQAQCLESALKASRSPRILHLATHGFFLADQEVAPQERGWGGFGDGERLHGPGMENPLLRSGLALAGANTFLRGGQPPPEAEDGLLTADDVSGLDLLDTELVVLSACETGLGEVHVGEGVFGLRRAFVLSGAQTLVMSLWRVGDDETRGLMEAFYANLLAGQPRAEALRAAQLAVKARHPHPAAWGAFILQGEVGTMAAAQ